jgi:hypothetical protein
MGGALALAMLASVALAQRTYRFDIPEQPAREAIRALAQESGLQIAARTDDLTGIRTNPVHGVYAPIEALRLLVKGTGLRIDLTQGNSVAIHRELPEVMPLRNK